MDISRGTVENSSSVVPEPSPLRHLQIMSEEFFAAVPNTVPEAGPSPVRIADETGPAQQARATDGPTICQLLPYYLAFVEHEWRLARKTRDTYGGVSVAPCRFSETLNPKT